MLIYPPEIEISTLAILSYWDSVKSLYKECYEITVLVNKIMAITRESYDAVLIRAHIQSQQCTRNTKEILVNELQKVNGGWSSYA